MVDLKFYDFLNGAHVVAPEDMAINWIKIQQVHMSDLNCLVNVFSPCKTVYPKITLILDLLRVLKIVFYLLISQLVL